MTRISSRQERTREIGAAILRASRAGDALLRTAADAARCGATARAAPARFRSRAGTTAATADRACTATRCAGGPAEGQHVDRTSDARALRTSRAIRVRTI